LLENLAGRSIRLRMSAAVPECRRAICGLFSGELPKPALVVIGHKSGRWEGPHNDTKKTQSVGIHYW
jgi:hypothetical protein